jgi:hypothetical protein
MSALAGIIGSLVIFACLIRGIMGFYQDLGSKQKKEETN